jgi:hypothetical protein
MILSHIRGVTIRRGLDWRTDLLISYIYTPLGTISNYRTTANLHNSLIITAPAKQRLLTVEILQFPHSGPCQLATLSKLSTDLEKESYITTDGGQSATCLGVKYPSIWGLWPGPRWILDTKTGCLLTTVGCNITLSLSLSQLRVSRGWCPSLMREQVFYCVQCTICLHFTC